jgi:hypothetical protein
MDDTNTIAPPPCAAIIGSALRASRQAPMRLVSSTFCQVSSLSSLTAHQIPASRPHWRRTISIRSKRDSVSKISLRQPSSRPTCAEMAAARAPLAMSSAHTALHASALRDETTTAASKRASRRTVARPIPQVEPVTTAALPCSEKGSCMGVKAASHAR